MRMKYVFVCRQDQIALNLASGKIINLIIGNKIYPKGMRHFQVSRGANRGHLSPFGFRDQHRLPHRPTPGKSTPFAGLEISFFCG